MQLVSTIPCCDTDGSENRPVSLHGSLILRPFLLQVPSEQAFEMMLVERSKTKLQSIYSQWYSELQAESDGPYINLPFRSNLL